MGLMKRFSMIFKSKASKTLDRYEDPRETLDYSYERTLEMLQKPSWRDRPSRRSPRAVTTWPGRR